MSPFWVIATLCRNFSDTTSWCCGLETTRYTTIKFNSKYQTWCSFWRGIRIWYRFLFWVDPNDTKGCFRKTSIRILMIFACKTQVFKFQYLTYIPAKLQKTRRTVLYKNDQRVKLYKTWYSKHKIFFRPGSAGDFPWIYPSIQSSIKGFIHYLLWTI